MGHHGGLPALRRRAFVTRELVYRRPDGEPRFTLSGQVITATMGAGSFNILRGDIEAVLYEAVGESAAIRFGTTGTISAGGRTFAMMSVGDGRTAAFFGYRGDLGRPRRSPEELHEVYGDMGWLVPRALEGLRSADSVYFDTISQMVVDRWSHGRVVLLGDAAWCVTLFAGYGSSLAVGGADLLGAALERHPGDVAAALAEWEARLRPEAEKKQRLGRRVKGVYAPRNRVALELTQLPLRLSSWGPVRRMVERGFQLRG
ncbi:FAD-dependent monooxygenase [Streptosporangium sandarakinum]|uniref:FAD-dependent monooxygenase n=1 Tax=Streptosporangium nondiastaticum TaxID=35764 RepID=UPI0035E70E91